MKKIVVLWILALGLIACNAKKVVIEETKTEMLIPMNALSNELFAGKTIFEMKCNKCHDLPVFNNYTKNRWVSIMKDMQNEAKISDEERELVYNYVTMNL